MYICYRILYLVLDGVWTVLQDDQTYRSYSVLSVSADRALIALGNITGNVKLLTSGKGRRKRESKKQETKRFSTFAVYRLRHSETKKNIA